MRGSRSALLLLMALSCKVPYSNVNAGFVLSDATWFEDEQTLFFFYRVDAEQGLGPDDVPGGGGDPERGGDRPERGAFHLAAPGARIASTAGKHQGDQRYGEPCSRH